MGHKIAVIGATGAVGREVLTTLSERGFDIKDITVLASSRSAGTNVSYGDVGELTVQNLATFDFKGTDIVLSSPGAAVSAEYSPKAAAAGAIVIDNTSHFRMDPDVPLIVPEVNPEDLGGYKKRNIIANPNCSTIQMVHVLKPLHDAGVIKRVVVSTYQAVSGSGKDAMDELFNQTRGIFVNDPITKECFTKQIAFNVIPHIDVFMDDGYTKEEWKMNVETKKILDPKIKVTATCVRVPVFIGHAEAISVEFEKEVTVEKARELLKDTPGITVIDHRQDEGYVTPQEAAGEDATFVSRIRADPTVDFGLNLWVVADNLRKGAALNTVQIAELLIKDHLS
ncbi:MAG: aspartate-semialdehyde dehydrogenase [Halopseudomonas aestusnigri]